MNFLNSCW